MTNVINLQARRYDAASRTTRTSNWLAPSTDANAAITNPQLIRNRARDLVRNNPWAAKGVSVIVNNVVGYGIRAQWQAPAKRNAKRAQDLWKAWAESKQCDSQGQTDFYGIQQSFMRSIVENGECLIRLRPRTAQEGLAVPLQLQIMEPDYLYEFNDGPTKSGGYIQRGIEYNGIGQRVAYYLHKFHPGAQGRFAGSLGGTFSRVPAYEVIHGFRTDRPGQERGVSWLAPVIIRLRELDIFEDAFLNRQKLANLFAGFVYTEDTTEIDELTDIDELTSGSLYVLKSGRRIEFSTPPTAADYGPYTLSNLRAVAAGLGITYEALTGDLSQVNFSSARMGWQEFGRSVDGWQWRMMIPILCHGVARWFSDFAGIPDITPTWTPPARMMVDPAREIPAIKEAIRSGLLTQAEAIREQGYDPENFIDEVAEFNAKLDEKQITFDTDPRKTSGAGQSQSTGSNDATNPTNP